jgi:hypothetical protein
VDPVEDLPIWFYLPEETDAEILLAEVKKHQTGFHLGIKFFRRQWLA